MEIEEGAELLSKNKQQKYSSYLNTLAGIGFTQLYCVFMTASTTVVQLLRREVPDFQLNAMRMLFGWIFLTFWFVGRSSVPRIPREAWGYTSALIVCSAIGTLSMYIAVTYIPLGSFQSVSTSIALLVGLVVFRIALNESLQLDRILAAVICVVGVVLVLQPYHPNGESTHTHSVPYNSTSMGYNHTSSDYIIFKLFSLDSLIGFILAAVGGAVLPFDTLVTKKLNTIIDINSYEMHILFWLCLTSFIYSAIVSIIFETLKFKLSVMEWVYIIIHSSTYIINIWSLIVATVKLTANSLNILVSMIIIYMTICQYTLLRHILPGYQNWQEIMGIVLVLLASILASLKEYVIELLINQNIKSKEDLYSAN